MILKNTIPGTEEDTMHSSSAVDRGTELMNTGHAQSGFIENSVDI
jgi:hypothetical protein